VTTVDWLGFGDLPREQIGCAFCGDETPPDRAKAIGTGATCQDCLTIPNIWAHAFFGSIPISESKGRVLINTQTG